MSEAVNEESVSEGFDSAESAESAEVVQFRSAVPSRFDDLQRKSKRALTINDLVESELPKVWGDPIFQKLISAIFKEESVEGSLHADDLMAARMLRESTDKGSELRTKNLEAIRKALRVVLRRYEQSREDRLRQVRSIEG